MKFFHHHHLPFFAVMAIALVVFVACADEQTDPYADEDMEVVATSSWQCGRSMGVRSTIQDPVGEVDGSGNSKEFVGGPQLLHITVGDGDDKPRPTTHPEKFIVKNSIYGDNDGYIPYHEQYLPQNITFTASGEHAILQSGTPEPRALYSKSIMTGLRVEANTLSPRFDGSASGGTQKIPQAWDNEDIASISRIDHLTTKQNFGGSYTIDGNHIFLTLGHVSALLRLHFAVDSKYAQVRYIDLKSVTINHQEITTEEHCILPVAASTGYANHQLFGYAYLKPSHDFLGNAIATIPSVPFGATSVDWTGAVGTATPLTFVCTYDIYDKDAGKIADFTQGKTPTAAALTAAAAHLTRYNVTATNTVTLSSASITVIKAGYYYDLYITINPDYLYVLSEHDNKHLIVN